jgi:hypothetical protein
MPMKRRSFPLWLLRDVPVFVAVLASFWPLMIFLILSGGKAVRAGYIAPGVQDRLAILVAHAEARLDYALWRQAYRRLGWNPRAVKQRFTALPPTALWADTITRLKSYNLAFRNMERVVNDYVEHLREQHRIRRSDLVARGSTDARLYRAAHHERVDVAPRLASTAAIALILSGARGARPSKDERGRAHARGPPTHPHMQHHPPRRPRPRDRIAMPELPTPAYTPEPASGFRHSTASAIWRRPWGSSISSCSSSQGFSRQA